MLSKYKIIDLTHTISEEIPQYSPHRSGACGFKQTIDLDYNEGREDVTFRVHKIDTYAGIGTHIDAPVHCVPGAKSVDQVALENLIVPCVVIDISDRADEDYLMNTDVILEFEEKHGQMPSNSLVLIYTGWEERWSDADNYLNNYKFPSIDGECAKLFVERDVAGIGVDTPTPDRPDSKFPVHKTLFAKNKYILESVANISHMPPVGGYALALPIKIKDGSEAPIRLVGLVE